jgi:hypothetical protein
VEILVGGSMAVDFNPVMNIRAIPRYLPVVVLILGLNSCVARRTVTENGRTVQQHNVIKRPIRDVIRNSQ